ncbi:MAG: hypothetical protein DWQ34_12920 [Planctomycetota bacterium]|nr:MAG: hypothetical protein DWQ34_12920 [Planctomycetota bacterium]REJ95695.1 MAG: hypothetical protein DWQ29_01640 [Planctomycetota bacterium]REK22931.1 MAG: hypothetical protein DWQ41_18150 [Planctomycetota bacterium]REK27781.1 MAG: hypothetical protein DWQ45_25295 [Planctomycetota bacterium]
MDDDDFIIELQDAQEFQQQQIRGYLANALTHVPSRIARRAESAQRTIKEQFQRCRHALFRIYDPRDFTSPGSSHSESEVYLINYHETVTSDFIILHLFAASTGLGVEAQLAAEASVPRIIIHKSDFEVSRMLLGIPTRTIATISYGNVRELREALSGELPSISRELVGQLPVRRRLLDAARSAGIGRFIMRMRIKKLITREDMAQRLGASVAWVQHIERWPECAVHLNVALMTQIAAALECEVTSTNSGVLALKESATEVRLTQSERDSMDALTEFVQTRNPRNESRVFEMWHSFAEMQNQAVAGREALPADMTVDDWEDLYGSETLF